MSVELSSEECRQYIVDDNQKWGSYSGSEFSTSFCSNMGSLSIDRSSKFDETTSLSSNDSGIMLGKKRIPKLPPPMPSLGRRKRTQLNENPSDIFQFSDSFTEPSPIKDSAQNISSGCQVNENSYSNWASEKEDRYAVFRNIDPSEENTMSIADAPCAMVKSNNPFATAFSKPSHNGSPDSARSDDSIFDSIFSKNHEVDSHPEVASRESYQNDDKYAAISKIGNIVTETSNKSMNLSHSVMGHGKLGWSDQILHGNEHQGV